MLDNEPKDNMFYMFRSGTQRNKQANKQANKHTHPQKNLEINKVKLATSKLKFLHCKTVFCIREERCTDI